jgi:hypothetical protein
MVGMPAVTVLEPEVASIILPVTSLGSVSSRIVEHSGCTRLPHSDPGQKPATFLHSTQSGAETLGSRAPLLTHQSTERLDDQASQPSNCPALVALMIRSTKPGAGV